MSSDAIEIDVEALTEDIQVDVSSIYGPQSGEGLSDEVKQALLDCFAHVAWTDEHGQDYYDALENALYPPADLVSISAVYTQAGDVYTTTPLNDLKADLVVTALYDDQSTAEVLVYTLSGTLTAGTSTITVSYGGKTTTFTVTVTEYTTSPVIQTEGVCWSKNAPNTTNKAGFGITKWYDYEFTQEMLESCQYWDSTNQYMTVTGWCNIKCYTASVKTIEAGYTWPSAANYKDVLGKDHVYVNQFSITANTERTLQFTRQSVNVVNDNCVSFTIPLLDKDDCYAYWYKGNGILPLGVQDGDIIYAGANTPYYGMHNIHEAD